jgi:hypothetical protein
MNDKPATPADRAAALIEALGAIPVEELVACARENLRATYPVRVSKTESRDAPDYTVRQKALEWISAQRAGAPPVRKPLEPPKAEDDKAAPKGRKAGAS